jgi:hypothetical protein
MNYTVRWLRPAEAKLRALWLRAADPEVIADAADAVNRLLRDAPFDRRVPRPGRPPRLVPALAVRSVPD